MQVRIWPASLPPPVASNASVAPVATSALVRSSMNDGELESQTCCAPMRCSSSTCSGLRTMLTSADAVFDAELVEHLAEVRRSRGVHERVVAFEPHRLDHAERGQRIDEARRAFGRRRARRQQQALRRLDARYCEYIAPPRIATVLPSSACAAADEPAATTTPAPSLPTGMRLVERGRPWPASAVRGCSRSRPAGRRCPTLSRCSCRRRRTAGPRSEGLIGAASTRTSTSSGPGSGTGRSTSESSSSPLRLDQRAKLQR